MRLQPVPAPEGLVTRIAYWMTKRRFGKVVTPLQVVYARVPNALKCSYEISKLMEHGFSLDKELQFLLKYHIAAVNECHFCVDIAEAMALQGEVSVAKARRLSGYREDPIFSDAERAALAYTEEVSRTKTASDATFEELRRHYDDKQIVEITLLNALENYYNLVNRPLGIESDGLCALVPRKK